MTTSMQTTQTKVSFWICQKHNSCQQENMAVENCAVILQRPQDCDTTNRAWDALWRQMDADIFKDTIEKTDLLPGETRNWLMSESNDARVFFGSLLLASRLGLLQKCSWMATPDLLALLTLTAGDWTHIEKAVLIAIAVGVRGTCALKEMRVWLCMKRPLLETVCDCMDSDVATCLQCLKELLQDLILICARCFWTSSKKLFNHVLIFCPRKSCG